MDKTGQRETQCRGPVTAGDGDNEGAGPRKRSVNSGAVKGHHLSRGGGRWQVRATHIPHIPAPPADD